MSPSLITDLIVVLIVLLACFSGWRQGAITSVLCTIGVVAGLIVGAALAPMAMQLTDAVVLRFLLALAVVVILVVVGNIVGGMIGAALRRQFRTRTGMKIDSGIGAVFQGVATLLVVWLISIPIATGIGGTVATGIGGSQLLGTVDRVAPAALSSLPTRISSLLDDSGVPQLVPFNEVPSSEVAAPAIKVADTELVASLRPSVIHVMGDATVCRKRLMGSGFVIADDYVVTNAHVVAGTDVVRLDTTIGVREADVVLYNPEIDIAVLHAQDLGLPPLKWADDQAESGSDAIVMGFPESGPFEAAPARIGEELTIAGPDIYAEGRVEREAYTVRGSIREGNSGGPLVDAAGDVEGLVFGASVDNSDIGYALTADEVRSHLGDVTALTTPVDTQSCIM